MKNLLLCALTVCTLSSMSGSPLPDLFITAQQNQTLAEVVRPEAEQICFNSNCLTRPKLVSELVNLRRLYDMSQSDLIDLIDELIKKLRRAR
ncbi:hypothetical protein HOL34_02120 [bacterium]|jgi:hypothetical protein|nr:hypothetical protein [bacterium]MBT3903695.1 hypothetical protein [bacterium]MBT4577581.1 hypothetical protein [bacterium]MBT5345741.1 hypothetical protein [bacterium]MBT6130918.1 hypothetical protein [bacterium]